MGTHVTSSPASSIAERGIVRFTGPEDRTVPGEDARGSGIVELPSFTSDDTSRPTVQMPPLTDQRERPASIDDAFDRGGADDDPAGSGSGRPRSSTLLGVVPREVPPRGAGAAPAPIASEETLPIGGITRAPAPPRT